MKLSTVFLLLILIVGLSTTHGKGGRGGSSRGSSSWGSSSRGIKSLTKVLKIFFQSKGYKSKPSPSSSFKNAIKKNKGKLTVAAAVDVGIMEATSWAN